LENISLFCRALLQKKPIILRSLLIVATLNSEWHYEVATISRLLKITGLFCKRALEQRRYSAKETCNFKEPTNRRHPIGTTLHWVAALNCIHDSLLHCINANRVAKTHRIS